MAEIRRIRPEGIEWVDGPPAPVPPKVDVVAAHLKAHAGQWAVIARRSSPLFAWWMPLRNSALFEVETRKSDPKDAGLLFAPVDVYARYAGAAEALPDAEGAPAE